MWRFFKRKSKLEKLEEQYRSILNEAFHLSKINRTQSDEKYSQAEEILKEIEKLSPLK